jgi:hypothetical protein
LESAVEHFSNFSRFCSTFEAAHPEFEPAGRQKSHIYLGFCLLYPLCSKAELQANLKERHFAAVVSGCTGFSLRKALHDLLAANGTGFSAALNSADKKACSIAETSLR